MREQELITEYPYHKRRYKILIVDDNRVLVKAIGRYLENEGYEIIKAYDGLEAIEKVQEHPDIDLILMDISMPKMDGIEAAKRIKSSKVQKFIPIVFLTGAIEDDDKLEALHYAEELLRKPMSMTELKLRVSNILKIKAYRDHLEEMLDRKTMELRLAMKELERLNESLREAQQETIYRLALAAEYKDEDTANHLKRMSHYSYVIADRLGLPSWECEKILLAAPMHDIGKIGIPDSILLKPGRPTPEEWNLIKQHPIIGAKILSESPYELLNVAEEIALTHHEKWNKPEKAYPIGIKGEKIPLRGRIVAVADVFDALTSKRPYKAPWTLEDAAKYIENEAGGEFDPAVVEAFLKGLNEIKDIKHTFSD